MRPAVRREVAGHLQVTYHISERRACQATGFGRPSQRYRKRADPQAALRMRLLHAILAALAPPETGGLGFDDLVETLSDLTVAVADVTEAVRGLRWRDCNPPPVPEAP